MPNPLEVRVDLSFQPPKTLRVYWHPYKDEILHSLDATFLNETGVIRDTTNILISRSEAILEQANNAMKEVSHGLKTTDWKDIGTRVGENLYDAILADERTCQKFCETYDEALQKNQTLRIEVNTISQDLARLPWELLKTTDALDSEPFAISFNSPVIRRAGVFDRPWHIQEPVKILLATASPVGDYATNADQEFARIANILKSATWLEGRHLLFPPLRNTTLSSLGVALRELKPHVLHLTTHGNPGSVEVEDDITQRRRVISAELLKSTIFNNHPDLAVFITTSCESAAFPTEGHKFSIAHMLSQAGIPIVVGMQFDMSEEASLLFSGHLYSHLSKSYGFVHSVTAARQKIREVRPDSGEWASPVIYLGVSEFDVLFADEITRTFQSLANDLISLQKITPQLKRIKQHPQPETLESLIDVLISIQNGGEFLETNFREVIEKESLTDSFNLVQEQVAQILEVARYMFDTLITANKLKKILPREFFTEMTSLNKSLPQIVNIIKKFVDHFSG